MNNRINEVKRRTTTLDINAMSRHADKAEDFLKALASKPRLMVLCHLTSGEHSVSELLGEIPLSASALSQHLAILREQGLVTTRRDAQSIYYKLKEGPALEVISILNEAFCKPGKSRRSRKKR